MTNAQTPGTELTPSQQTNAAIIMPVYTTKQAVDRMNAVTALMKNVMIKGVDYAIIPGTGTKPSLMKAGAEKLVTFFGLQTRFIVLESEQDWSGKDHGGEPFFYYWYRCQLWNHDFLVAEADGSCNTFECKYRYRWVRAEQLPGNFDMGSAVTKGGSVTEYAFAIDKAETSGQYGKPAEYWKKFDDAIADGTAKKLYKPKKNGNGTMLAWEIEDLVYRVPNEDIATQVNTVQKMSQKRAFVAATLIATNASNLFTQDVEDMGFVSNVIDYEAFAKPDEMPNTPENPAINEAHWKDAPPDEKQDDAPPFDTGDQNPDNAMVTQGQSGALYGSDIENKAAMPPKLLPKVNPDALFEPQASFAKCKKCGHVVATLVIGNNQLAYNRDGLAHPPTCGNSQKEPGWGM